MVGTTLENRAAREAARRERSARPVARWVVVAGPDGRRRMEARWILPAAPATRTAAAPGTAAALEPSVAPSPVAARPMAGRAA
jgi:hypothetical protein